MYTKDKKEIKQGQYVDPFNMKLSAEQRETLHLILCFAEITKGIENINLDSYMEDFFVQIKDGEDVEIALPKQNAVRIFNALSSRPPEKRPDKELLKTSVSLLKPLVKRYGGEKSKKMGEVIAFLQSLL